MMFPMVMILVWTPISAAISTVVLSSLVRWYLVPLGFPDLRLLHLYGVALAISYVTIPTPDFDDTRGEVGVVVAGEMVMFLLRAGLVFSAGWVALQLAGGSV